MLSRGQRVRMFPEPSLHEDQVMQGRNNREPGRCVQKGNANNADPSLRIKLQQHDKKNCRDLTQGIRFAEDAWAEIAQACNCEQYRTGSKNRDVPAKYEDGVLPSNFVQDREHQEDRAQQQFVCNRVEILAEQGLLVKPAGEQTVQAIAEPCDNENRQSPVIMAIHELDHDERYENHPQQRELVGGGEYLGESHVRSLIACD